MSTNTGTKWKVPLIALFSILLWTVGCSDQQPTVVLSPDAPQLSSSEITPHPMNAAALDRAGSLEFSPASSHGAIIDNGIVQMGVLPQGHLGVPGGTPSSGTSSTTVVGLRFMPTNSDATAPGCVCEGWGVADARTGVWGGANVSVGGVQNVTLESFTSTASTATSVVRVGNTFRVTHDYRPSGLTANLYVVTVTFENISDATVDLRYRRVIDWDIAPNTFNEFVTIQGTAHPLVLGSSSNGFASPNPLSSRGGTPGDFVNLGPGDLGALFDFGFGELAPGETSAFLTYYGATPDQASALAALDRVGASVYSFGQANYDGSGWVPAPGRGAPTGRAGADRGIPHTFIFAFAFVAEEPPPPPPPACTEVPLAAVWSNGGSPGTIRLGDRNVFVLVSDVERFIPRPARASDVRLGPSWAAGTPARRFAITDLTGDGNRDIVVEFRMSDLRRGGNLTEGTTSVTVWGQDRTTGTLYCGTTSVDVEP